MGIKLAIQRRMMILILLIIVDNLIKVFDILFKSFDFGFEDIDLLIKLSDLESALIDGVEFECIGFFELIIAFFDISDGVFQGLILVLKLPDQFNKLVQCGDGNSILQPEVSEEFFFFLIVVIDLVDHVIFL